MKPVDQPGMTLYTADGCAPLPVVLGQGDYGPVLISAWELDVDEMELIQKTGRVWLWVQGTAQPPVSITVESPFTDGK